MKNKIPQIGTNEFNDLASACFGGKPKQQTAVEWLIEQLVVMDKQLDGRRKNEDATVMKMNPTKILEQAKEMEKQQIIIAYDLGMGHYGDANCKYDAEEYYNKTFKNK